MKLTKNEEFGKFHQLCIELNLYKDLLVNYL